MLFGADWLANLFLFVFLFGLIFTTASLLLGFAHAGDLHLPHIHIDAGDGSLDAGVHHDVGAHHGPSVLNIPTVMAFLTWFGGVGYILRQSLGLHWFISVFAALLSGLLGGAIMFILLARVLWPLMTRPMSKEDYQLPGTPARVVSSIRAGGVGEVVYTKAGSRFTAGARSVDGEPIPKGAEVVIIRYERGIAYVQDVNKLLGDSAPSEGHAVGREGSVERGN
jgi:hypothetical protein